MRSHQEPNILDVRDAGMMTSDARGTLGQDFVPVLRQPPVCEITSLVGSSGTFYSSAEQLIGQFLSIVSEKGHACSLVMEIVRWRLKAGVVCLCSSNLEREKAVDSINDSQRQRKYILTESSSCKGNVQYHFSVNS